MAKKDLIKRADGSYSPRGLWDNIRANKGSGKAPTKEMLAQENKIKREMAKGGSLSHFYPSNIQAYAEGGPIEDLMEKFYKKNATANIYASPFYTNALVGNFKPGYIAGIETDSGLGRKAPGFYASAYAGQQYNPSVPFNTILSPEQQAYQNSITDITVPEPGETGPLNTAALTGGAPNAQNILLGGKIGWQGKVVKGGGAGGNNPIFPNAMPRIEAGLEYAPSTGLGGHWEVGSVFPFGNNYRNGLVKAGRPAGMIEPYTGMTLNSTEGSKLGWGVRAEGEYRPRAFKDFPMSFYGKAALTGGFGAMSNKANTVSNIVNEGTPYESAGPQDKTLGTMFRPHVSGELGVRFPLQQIEAPNINMPDINLSPLTSFLGRADKGGEENLQMGGGDPIGDFGNRYNASPIDKRWNKNAEDIYINHNAVNRQPMETITYDPNDPEGLGENNFKQGGAMNFKSPAAYKAWLAYGHATGEFEKTPGNQAVSIKGQPHKVQHALGGNLYSMGGRAFAQGGQLTEFNEGGTHEQNPLGGIPQGFAQDGKLNLVEQGETKLNAADYVFSDQIKVSKETATLYDLPKSAIGKTFAEVSKKVNRPDSRRENDSIEQVAIQRDLENLMQAQEQQKETEKQEAIAEMQSKYPDLQVVDQAAMQQADAEMQAGMQQPMMDEQAMMQQQQMAPPAQAPQEMDPAIMAQMQQQGMLRHGGMMYNMGGHMYSMGGNVGLRAVGSAAYGVGEGLLDNLTFGLTDPLTDQLDEKLSSWNADQLDEKEQARLDAARNFGNVAGQVGGAVLTGGTTTKQAIGAGIENLGEGIAALPGTDENVDKYANAAGQLGSMYGQYFGGAPAGVNPAASGALAGNKAANQLLNAPQNKFISQAMNVAGNYMAQGGYLGSNSSNPFVNQYALGSELGEPVVNFNINGTLMPMTLAEASNNPTIIDMFMPENADVDGDGEYTPEEINMAKLAISQYFDEAPKETLNPIAPIPAGAPGGPALTGAVPAADMSAEDVPMEDVTVAETLNETGTTLEDLYPKFEGETDAEYKSRLQKLVTSLDKKDLIGEIKANPVLAGTMALPALYNIGRGLFGKADKLDMSDYSSRGMINPYEMNIDPQLASTNRAFGNAMAAARNAAPGAGSYLATLGNLASQKQQAIKDIYAQKENFDKAQKLEADKYNAQKEQNNADKALQIAQYNAQAEAAKANLLAQGLTQAAQAAEGLTSQDLQEAYLHAIAPDLAANFSYVSIPEQIAAAARKKNKKADKNG